MRIAVHDYGGHAFILDLSRTLARRGHEILHVYFADFVGPKGSVERQSNDPESFWIEPIHLDRPFDKYSLLRRRFQEQDYARRAAARLHAFRPEIVLSANTPLEAQQILLPESRRLGARFIFWMQDFFSVGIKRVLARKLPVLGDVIARHYERMERRLLSESDHVIYIADEFAREVAGWGVRTPSTIIHNWPSAQIQVARKDNPWARAHGLADKTCFLYSGTLGFKHDPALLAALAERLQAHPDMVVVVVSEGPGAEWLEAYRRRTGLANLHVLPFQPHACFHEVLGSGDVMIATIEWDAAAYSVPSKVLSYLVAGRPILLAVPPDNLAARMVTQAKAGIVVTPDAKASFLDAAEELAARPDLRARYGANAACYAAMHFDRERIADRFEALWSDEGRRAAM